MDTAPLQVILCEPYFAGSHRAWAEGLVEHSAHRIHLVTHAGRFWKWRMQGAALIGLAGDALAGVPVVIYFHENQLTYPTRDGEAVDHRRRPLHHAGWRQRPGAAGCAVEPPLGPRQGPAAFFRALDAVDAAGVAFRLIVAGESFQTIPPEFARARERFADRIIAFGTADDAAYPTLLRRADIVVSTARHEFFGVAVVEAITAGALPLLPRRLSYPELVPQSGNAYLYTDHDDLVARLSRALTDHERRRTTATAARDHVARFAWSRVAPRYDRLPADVAAG